MARKRKSSRTSSARLDEPTRRDFLRGATSMAAGVIAAPLARSESASLLPTIALGPHRVTRLIVGSNPIYGYSHFNSQYDQHMLEWFTDERIVRLLADCERAGINTWQASYNLNMSRQFPMLRGAGCKIQFICLAASWHYDEKLPHTPEAVLDGTIKCAEGAARFKPIGVAFHGHATDLLFRARKLDMLKTYVDKVHDLGILAGISTHNPVILEALEEKGWPNDFYMASFHYLSRHREDWERDIGVVPVGEGFIASDPPRMCEAVRKVKKPTLVYKVLAAGRKCQSSQEVREAFEWAFKNIKPTDAAIVGLYPRYSDQIGEDAAMVRAITS